MFHSSRQRWVSSRNSSSLGRFVFGLSAAATRVVASTLVFFTLVSASLAQVQTLYWTGNEDRWGGGNQTPTADDNFSLTPGGTDYKKLSAGERYHHVYDRSPAGQMAGTNYGVSMNRINNTIDSMVLVGDSGLGFTFNTTPTNSTGLLLNGNITVSGGTHVFNNAGGIIMKLGDTPTIDVAEDSQLLWKIPLTPDSATVRGITKTGDGVLAIAGDHDYTGLTKIESGAFGVFDAPASLLGDLYFVSGSQLLFNDTYTLTVAGDETEVTFDAFGVTDLLGLDLSVDLGTYTLIDGNVDFTNISNVGFANAYDLGGGKLAYFGGGSLVLNVVPEPSSLFLAVSALAGLLFMRRRRARS
jgi:autotransporter-associated beta strand protein